MSAAAFPLLAAIFVIAAFFGHYAFDDAYVGYSNALNLGTGHGFVFNLGERSLTTSAPLIVPLYAALYHFCHVDIVTSAQVASAVALVVLSLAAYAILRSFSSALAASAGAFIIVTSPFTFLLWSHETLLWMSFAATAVWLFLKRKLRTSALTAGASMLLRPESFLLIALLTAARRRRGSIKETISFAMLAALPFAAWALYALPQYGTVFSQSIAAKHAQFLYGGISYVHGLLLGTLYSYSVADLKLSAILAVVLPGLILLTILLRDRYPALPWTYAWAVVTTLLYLLAAVHFFPWFTSQVPLLAGACCAAALRAAPTSSTAVSRALWHARYVLALILVFANAYFVTIQIVRPQVKYEDAFFVMPRIADNAYYRLALWLHTNTARGESVAYPEIGELKYYSGRNIVDYIGLASPGVAEHMLEGDLTWAFKRYKPTIVVDEPDNWHYLVDLREYTWFLRAYSKMATVSYPSRELRKDTFNIYRLQDPSALPPVEQVEHATVRPLSVRRGGVELEITPRTWPNAIEVRVASRGCRAVESRLQPLGGSAQLTRLSLPQNIPGGALRLRLDVPRQPFAPHASFVVSFSGCPSLILAPPTLQRRPSLLSRVTRVPGNISDAVTVYADPLLSGRIAKTN